MAGWGRRAAGKIDRTQYGTDQLLQTLGGQFNVDFSDYEKWKRTTKPAQTLESTKQQKAQFKLCSMKSRFTKRHCLNCPTETQNTGRCGSVIKASHIVGPGQKTGRICAPVYKRNSRTVKKGDEEPVANAERLKILELRIQTRRKTLHEYIRRQRALLVDNICLREDIEDYEGSTNGTVKSLLRKYEGFSHGISNLKNLSNQEIEEANSELQSRKHQLEKILKVIGEELNEIEDHLSVKQKQVQVLQSYKDKEYPVKAIEIADLKKELDEVESVNQADQDELEHVIKCELEKYSKKQDQTRQNITEKAAETAINTIHPSLQKMAVQNTLMKKEIELHQEERTQLERVIEDMKTEVKRLLHDPKTNTRQQLFPEFFPKYTKCTPDMEIVLDIPVHQWLPI